MEINCEVVVGVPIDAAFSYYANQDHLQEWVPGGRILEFIPLTPPPKRPGSLYRMAYRSFGVTFRLTAKLTALELNKQSVMEQVSGDYESFHYEMHFDSSGTASTRMKMKICAVLPWGWLGIALDRLTQPFAQRDMEDALRRFKHHAESLQRSNRSNSSSAANKERIVGPPP